MSEMALVIERVEKRFEELTVLNGLSATIARGSITAFIGPNGAGKTTLFHTISGDLRSDRGSIYLKGNDISRMPAWNIARHGLGRLFQDVRIFRNLSVLDNVVLALHDHPDQTIGGSVLHMLGGKTRRDKAKTEAVKFLESVGLKEPYDRPAATLSWGNQKLLALARLLAGSFDFLLLDEPTAGLSPTMVDHILGVIEKVVNEQGVTVALIEHNIGFVSRIADYTYLLNAGSVHDEGPTAEVLTRPETIEICIGL